MSERSERTSSTARERSDRARPPRIVSLVPSATETLLALGADVVGCTKYCNQPQLPAFGGTKNPDVDAIVTARPDLVVVDTEENRRDDAKALRGAGLTLVVTAVRSLAGADDAVRRLAEAAGRPLPDTWGPSSVAPAAPRDATPAPPGHRAFVPIWRRPWMTVNRNTYGASLLDSIGVAVVTADAATEYPTVELDDIAGLHPSLVLVPSEPYSFGDAHLHELATALPGARVLRVDGEDLFWWGIRSAAARRRLAEAIGSGG